MHVRIIVDRYIAEADSDPHTIAYETASKIDSTLNMDTWFNECLANEYYIIRRALENGATSIRGKYEDAGECDPVKYSIEVLDQKVNPDS